MSETQTKFDHWCIVESFGHERIAGRVTEQTIGGCSFIRVDVPRRKRATNLRACSGRARFIPSRPLRNLLPALPPRRFKRDP